MSKPKSGVDVSPDGAPSSKGPASKSASPRSPSPKSPSARSKARRFALQALYQIQLTGCSAAAAEQQFLDDHEMKRVDVEYLHALLAGTSEHRDELE
ncbi:MAG: transcription termination factor NusB, partial [Candidatus Paceibacteria bacterium]